MENQENKIEVKKASKKVEKKEVAKVDQSKMVKAYRAYNIPSSGALLWSYTIAIFDFLGVSEGKSASKGALKSFYRSGTLVNHHAKNGNMETDAKDPTRVKLTKQGKAYFANRLNGTSAQRCSPEMVQGFSDLIRMGKTDCNLIPDSVKKDVIEIGFTN